MKQPAEIKKPGGKLGILLPGMGAVATTTIAGVMLARAASAQPIGSLTQLGTIRLGKRTEPLAAHQDFCRSRRSTDIVFGGWDIFPDNAYEAARHAEVLDARSPRRRCARSSSRSSRCRRSSTPST